VCQECFEATASLVKETFLQVPAMPNELQNLK
jgi:hypothetical protein